MGGRAQFPAIEVELPRIEPLRLFEVLSSHPPIRAVAPAFIIAALAPIVWWVFRDTWKRLDDEARAFLRTNPPRDYRPAVCLVLVAVTLTIHEYYGGRSFFESSLASLLTGFEADGHTWLQTDRFHRLYSYGWWVLARILGYVVVPLVVWKLLFPQDKILDMGLRLRGTSQHLWLYVLCLAVVAGVMLIVARQEDFLSYYPFYKKASRSWFDLLVWESIYFLQFFALEFFFRGWMLAALRRTLGAAAIFVMATPYCMIHYGKPYFEAHGAIIAGVVLGSLAMHTRSIYAGFLVHISVAGLMDYMALAARDALPTRFWPG